MGIEIATDNSQWEHPEYSGTYQESEIKNPTSNPIRRDRIVLFLFVFLFVFFVERHLYTIIVDTY